MSRPLTIAIHGNELDASTDTGNGTELLCPPWRFRPFATAVIGSTLSRQRDKAELWAATNLKHRATNHHSFEQIHPAEDGALI
jgi:hypothetical protein